MLAILLLTILIALTSLIIIIANTMKVSKLIKKSLLTFSLVSSVAISLLFIIHLQKIDYEFSLPMFIESSVEKVSALVDYDELPNNQFGVYVEGKRIGSFLSFKEAVQYAKNTGSEAQVHYHTPGAVVWQAQKNKLANILLDVPIINQLPELPRGCEVTSLAMLLEYGGIKADKLILAEEILKDETPYDVRNGIVYFGNPYKGFVGNMYDINQPGYGVYHGPITELAERYMPKRVVDMTGSSFEEILYPVTQGKPVLVVTNTLYQKLDKDQFQTWHTPDGPIEITFRMHAVVITGYNQEMIFFNDPLTNEKNRQVHRKSFEEAWIQMGRQAISFID